VPESECQRGDSPKSIPSARGFRSAVVRLMDLVDVILSFILRLESELGIQLIFWSCAMP